MSRSIILPFLAGALALGVVAFAQGPKDDPPAPTPVEEKKEEKKEEPLFDLMVGDPAPALFADEWLTGEETQIEEGKVYLVHFWASWSAPSLLDFVRMTELQHKYAEKGLVVVGFTREDDRGNRLFSVKKLLEQRASEIDFAMGWDAKGVTFERYMTASGHRKIPIAYLVDRTGRVAFLGHPGAVEETLEQVLAGKFDVDAAARKYAEALSVSLRKREIERELNTAYQAGKLGDVVLALDKLIALGPKFRHYAVNKFQMMLKDMKDPEGAYGWALEASETCLAEDSYALNTIAYSIVIRADLKPKNYEVAMTLAVLASKLEKDKDGQVWNTIGAIHSKRDEWKEAVAAMEKAVEFAALENQRMNYTKTLTTYRKKLKGGQ